MAEGKKGKSTKGVLVFGCSNSMCEAKGKIGALDFFYIFKRCKTSSNLEKPCDEKVGKRRFPSNCQRVHFRTDSRYWLRIDDGYESTVDKGFNIRDLTDKIGANKAIHWVFNQPTTVERFVRKFTTWGLNSSSKSTSLVALEIPWSKHAWECY